MTKLLRAISSLVLIAIPLFFLPGTARATAPVQTTLKTSVQRVNIGLHPLTHVARSVSNARTAASNVHPEPAHVVRESKTNSLTGIQNAVLGATNNWSGLVETGTTYTGIQGQWNVPAVTSTGGDQYSGSWIGIDGFGNSSLIQTGTGQQVIGGVAVYDAWFELLPGAPQEIAATVNPGDEMQALIEETSANVWEIDIEDVTQNWGFTHQFNYSTPGISAEWIEDAPTISGSQSQLADFNHVTFSQLGLAAANVSLSVDNILDLVNSSGDVIAYPANFTSNSFEVFYGTPPQSSPPPNNGGLVAQVVGMAALPDGSGYWLASADGGVSTHGAALNYGSMAGRHLNAPISHIVSTADGKGYWLVASDGGTFAFGNAQFYGSMGGRHLNAPVVDMAPTSDDGGYWLVASDGGIFAFGDARFHGSMGGIPLNKPVVGISANYATGGYWEVATDGGIFAFGAPFYGSAGSLHLNKPVNGMAGTSSGAGYWFVASDGGIFAYGNAGFYGSTGSVPLSAPIVGMANDQVTDGYWLVSGDGQVFSFNAPSYGNG